MGSFLYQFFCESELMADDYVAGAQGGARGSTPTFRTHIRLVDDHFTARSFKAIRVKASAAIDVTMNGVTRRIDGTTPLWLQTDGAGELSIVSHADTLSSPALYLWGNFMEDREAMVVYPDYHTLNTLSAVQTQDLTTAKSFNGAALLPASLKDASGFWLPWCAIPWVGPRKLF